MASKTIGQKMSISSLDQKEKNLVKQATESKVKAHCPYSKFNVGAALIAGSGEVYTGCNVENASYSLITCAERTAIVKAVSAGEQTIKCIAVVINDSESFGSPCGSCRQIIYEFGHATNCIVLMVKGEDECIRTTIKELLPEAFGPANLIPADN